MTRMRPKGGQKAPLNFEGRSFAQFLEEICFVSRVELSSNIIRLKEFFFEQHNHESSENTSTFLVGMGTRVTSAHPFWKPRRGLEGFESGWLKPGQPHIIPVVLLDV